MSWRTTKKKLQAQGLPVPLRGRRNRIVVQQDLPSVQEEGLTTPQEPGEQARVPLGPTISWAKAAVTKPWLHNTSGFPKLKKE